MDERTLFGAAGINRRTAYVYERLLTNLLVVEALPAWTSNRLKRLVLMPKRHLVEPALVGAVLGLDANLVLRSDDLIGHLLETFVVAQLRAELGLSAARPRLYHLRQKQGRTEVDLLAELAGGRLIAFEVKADAPPRPMPSATSRRCGTDTRRRSSRASSSTRVPGRTGSVTAGPPRRWGHVHRQFSPNALPSASSNVAPQPGIIGVLLVSGRDGRRNT